MTPNPAATTDRAQPPADARRARQHVFSLLGQGGTCRSIGEIAGVSPSTVSTIAGGHARHQPGTLRAVLAVNLGQLQRTRADAGGTRLRLRALHVMGHNSARIARAAGASPQTIRAVLHGRSTTVAARLRDAVIAVYDTWWDKQPPQHTTAQKAAATAARRRAIAGNWCPPLALDDDELDIPGYRPATGWRPAWGTGTAPNFRYTPPAPRMKEHTMTSRNHQPRPPADPAACTRGRPPDVIAGERQAVP